MGKTDKPQLSGLSLSRRNRPIDRDIAVYTNQTATLQTIGQKCEALNPGNQQINRFNKYNKPKSKELTISSKIRYK